MIKKVKDGRYYLCMKNIDETDPFSKSCTGYDSQNQNQTINARMFKKILGKKVGQEKKYMDDIEAYCMQLRSDLSFSNNHTIKYIDHFETKHFLYLITDHQDSGTLLNEEVRREYKPFLEEEVIEIVYQILLGLTPYHAENRMLNIISSENIYIHKGLYKIGHYDQLMDIYGKNFTRKSIPLYAAPESFYGEKPIGPLVDVWCLGCLAHTLLFGNRHNDKVNTM